MSRFFLKSIFFVQTSLVLALFLLFSSPLLAAEPGINLINNPNSQFYVPEQGTFNWLLYTPGSPQELNSWKSSAPNIVLRIHSAWTETGKLMLGLPDQQQQVATAWCQAINSINTKVYVEPFNELEHDYERLTPTGGIGLSSAITRANLFIGYLQTCLTNATVISPALDPQSADFPTTSQAFSRFSIISCHPYRLDTIDTCIRAAAGKPLIFTEIGVDQNGPKYDDCTFIDFFCNQGFINKVLQTRNLLAYFLFTFSPGNYDGFWELKKADVVKALKNQCSPNLTCSQTTDDYIDKLVENIKNLPAQRVAPVPNRGINPGPLRPGNSTLFQRVTNWFTALFDRQTSNEYPFPHKDNEQYKGEDAFFKSGDLPDMIAIHQPSATILDYVNTVEQNESVNILAIHGTAISGYATKEYAQTKSYLGYGKMFSIKGDHYDFLFGKDKVFRDWFDLNSGVSSRIAQNEMKNDQVVNKVLCRLAASADPNHPYFEQDPSRRLFDLVLGYMHPVVDSDFIYNLPINNPNQGPGIVDRTKTKLGTDQVPIRISTVFCINPDVDSFLDSCSAMGFGTINPKICKVNPYWLNEKSASSSVFTSFFDKLRQVALLLGHNTSAKAFLERCQEQNPKQCDSSNPDKRYSVYSTNFDQLDVDIRTHILDNNNGAYSKLINSTCFACRVAIIFFPDLTEATETIKFTGSLTTPYKTHLNLDKTPSSINYSQHQIDQTGVYTSNQKASMAMDNRHSVIDQNLTFTENIRSLFNRQIDMSCQPISVKNKDGQPFTLTACEGQKESILQTTLYVSKKLYKYINYSENYYKNMLPYSVQNKIKASVNKATDNQGQLTNLTKADYISNNNLGARKSLTDLVRGYLRGESPDSGSQSMPDSAKQVAYGKNLAVEQEIQQKMFTPYSWQQQISSQASTTSYDSNRPLPQDLPDTNRTPNTAWCNFITQTVSSYPNIDASLIAAIIAVESNGDPKAKSSQGAVGLMQVMPSDPLDRDDNPLYFDCNGKSCFINRPTTTQLLDPEFNIKYGIQLLSSMINYWGKNKDTLQEKIREGLKHYGPMNYEYKYADLVLAVQANNPAACQ